MVITSARIGLEAAGIGAHELDRHASLAGTGTFALDRHVAIGAYDSDGVGTLASELRGFAARTRAHEVAACETPPEEVADHSGGRCAGLRALRWPRGDAAAR